VTNSHFLLKTNLSNFYVFKKFSKLIKVKLVNKFKQKLEKKIEKNSRARARGKKNTHTGPGPCVCKIFGEKFVVIFLGKKSVWFFK
jgi:hypothetical protein